MGVTPMAVFLGRWHWSGLPRGSPGHRLRPGRWVARVSPLSSLRYSEDESRGSDHGGSSHGLADLPGSVVWGGVGGSTGLARSQCDSTPRLTPTCDSTSCSWGRIVRTRSCLLYTSDAADEEDSVDLGGRRIIKKKKQ
eukprot:TRINITY_DN10357_c0_g1_i3.p1 TRINITY_DN10357_c0_g1~~TRINITY_DN10357_c0_g1_i3.p1  ORF type:complete len:138 (-),score=16.36 TRINITY_DN10357_c0_g1_i3:73-486(-)